eukprot:s1928_g4.t2
MSLERLAADLITYNAAMSSCAGLSSSWQLTLSIFGRMEELSLRTDAVSYSAAGRGSLGQWRWALQLLGCMRAELVEALCSRASICVAMSVGVHLFTTTFRPQEGEVLMLIGGIVTVFALREEDEEYEEGTEDIQSEDEEEVMPSPWGLVSGGWDNTVQYWDLRAGHAVRAIFGPHICGDALDVSADGTQLLTGSCRDELMEDVGVYSTVLQPRISRVDTSGFGSGGTQVWRDGCLSPFQNAYKAFVHYVSGKMPEEMFVNSEGAYKVPLSLVLLILASAPLVPLALPLMATYGVWTVGWPRTGCDAILRLLGILLSWAPIALLIPLARMISTGQTLQLFEQEKISRVEVLGPFICCLLASLVFFSDVFLYIVERACAWMVWDEFAELEEKVFEVDEDVMEPWSQREHPKLVDRVVHFLQQLRENIRVQSAVFNRSYVVQSEFERRILFALEGGDHRRWLENPPLHNHRNNESWRLSVGSVFAGLVQALLPSLSRLCLGVEEPLLCDSGILMFIRITYCVTAFATAAFVARIGTLMRLHTFQLRCLAVLYLVAPDKRRKALGWQYWSLMENLRLTLPTEESDAGHEELPQFANHEQHSTSTETNIQSVLDSFTQLLFACTDSMRYTLFFDDVRGQVDEEMEKVNSLERVHEERAEEPEVRQKPLNESVGATKPRRKSRRRRATVVVGDDEQLLEEQPCPAHNKEVKILAARRFALLRIVTRANALVLQVHVEKLLSGILVVTVLYVTSEMLLVASEDSLTSASIVCLSNLLAIVALDMVDFIKNWQQPISLCGVEITSSKRNQVLVPMLSGVFYILGRALMQVNWASRLEVIAEQTAGNQLELWDIAKGERIKALPWRARGMEEPACFLYTARFSKDPHSSLICAGGSFASAEDGGEAKVFHYGGAAPHAPNKCLGTVVHYTCLSADFGAPETGLLAMGGTDGRVRIMSLKPDNASKPSTATAGYRSQHSDLTSGSEVLGGS